MRIRKTILFLSIYLFSNVTYSDALPQFEGGYLSLGEHVSILADPEGSCDLETILSKSEELGFKKPTHKSYLFNSKNKKYWLKGSFMNNSESDELFFCGWFKNIVLASDVKFYLLPAKGRPVEYRLDNYLRSRKNVFNPVDKCSLVKVEPFSVVNFLIEISSPHNIKTNLYVSDIFYQIGFFYNVSTYSLIINVLTIFSLFLMFVLWLSTRSNYFLYFTLYSICMNMIVGLSKNIIFLTDNLGVMFTSVLFVILRIFQAIFFIFFMRYFLSSRFHVRSFGKIFKVAVALIVLFNSMFLLKELNHLVTLAWISRFVSFFILISLYLFFCVVLFKIKHRYAYLFLFVYIMGVIPFFTSSIVEDRLGIYLGNISPNFFSLYDMASDLLIVLVLIIDRMHVARIEKAMDKNSERFVFALGTSENEEQIFSHALLSLKSYIDYDRAYFITEDPIGLKVLASIPGIEDKHEERAVCEFIEANREYARLEETRGFILFDREKAARFFNDALSVSLIPIRFEREIMGYTLLISRYGETYSNVERGLVNDFAQKAALVIEHFNKIKIINEKEKAIEIYENMGLFHKNSTHEIKIPLFSLEDSLGSLERIYRDHHKNERRDILEYVESMHESLDSAMDQIEESLSMVGAEESSVFDITYIRDNLNSLRKLCSFLDIKLEEDYLMPMDTLLVGPKKSIKNVINMIFKNGIEALEKTQRDSKVAKLSFIIEKGKLKITVFDNGYGMSEEAKRNIFKLYTEGKMLSSGQGLMICKSIIERLGGSIEINSSPGLFTKVDFTLDILHNKEKE